MSPPVTTPAPSLMTEKEAAFDLKVSYRTMLRWRKEGCGPSYFSLPGGIVRYAAEDLEAFRRARYIQGVAA